MNNLYNIIIIAFFMYLLAGFAIFFIVAEPICAEYSWTFFSLRVRNENFAKFGESGEICRSMKVILGMDNLFPMIISNVTGLGPQLIGWRYKLILN